MIVLAIDPGSTESALVWFDSSAQRVLDKYKADNQACLEQIAQSNVDWLAIEQAESFGAKVWSQVFTTVVWTGRFIQAWEMTRPGRTRDTHTQVTRREVKMHLTGSARAKDGQIRNCLIDRWGGKDKAIGSKKQPGPLLGVTADMWQALAIGVTYADRLKLEVAA